MTILLYLALIISFSLILVKAVNIFIRSASELAREFGVSEYTISFLLVAIGTSLPEVIVGVTAALSGDSILSYGNAIGSNITLVTLIMAMPILLGTGISTRYIIHSRDIYYSTAFAFLPAIMIVDGSISKIDGVVLVALYVVYTFTILKRNTPVQRFLESIDSTNLWKEFLFFVISLLLLLAASQGIVKSATMISTSLGIGLGFIGLTITAVGTSLPEIAVAVGAIKNNQQDEILGNIIGSVVANSTLVLGVASIINPIVLKGTNFGASTIFFLVFSVLIFLRFTKTREKLDKSEGVILLLIYVLFITAEFFLQ